MATLRAAIDARGATTGAAEFDRATGKMKHSAGTATKSIEIGFASAMRRILMFGGGGGAIYTLKKFIDSASDAQETMNKFNVVFKDNSKEAAAWAETFGNSVGRATQDVEKWMAGLQDLFVPLGFARKEAMKLSENLTTLAVDVASFSNQVDAEVIRDFTSALVGNHETVRKYGIIISETALKQEAYNQGINKNYEDLTDLEKVQLRYSLIQKGSTDAQGDAIRSMNDYANQVKRLNANWIEIKTTLGEPVMDVLSDLLIIVNKNDEATKRWIDGMMGGIEGVYEAAKKLYDIQEKLKSSSLKQLPPEYRTLSPLKMGVNIYDMYSQMKFPPHKTQYIPGELPDMRGQPPAESEEAALNRRLQETYSGPAAVPSSPVQQTEQDIKKRQELERQVIEDTRQGIESVRNQDYLTRMERIKNLEAYRDAHADTLGQVAEAERILNEEILCVERSRVDAMEVYQRELREDMEDSSLYISERFADTAQQIEGSMSNAFDSMISEGASFKDAMTGFAIDIGRAFSRMAADMAARAAMESIVGGIGGLFGPAPINAGTPGAGGVHQARLGDVFNRGRVVPFAGGGVLDRPTYFPMADGKTGLAGEAGPEAFFPLRRNRGRLGIEGSGGTPNITVSPTPVKVVFVNNMREAAIEAMKSKEGEQVHIQHAVRNRNLLR